MADQSFTSKPENLTEERSESASGRSIGRGKAILVAGMHRSGTSAMTRVLSLAGAGLPRTLMPPAADNPNGFWESGPVAQLNDELLREIGSRWDDVFGFVSRPDAARFRTSAISRIRQCLDQEFAATSLPVIKDPRLSLLMDLWIPALQQSQYDPCVVVLVRNPLEVAASLQQRNGFPSAKSSLVWAAYTLAVERSTRSLPRLFVDYEELEQNWRTVLSRTESALGIMFPQLTVSSQLEIERFLAKGARHHLASRAQLRARRDLAPWIGRIYDCFGQGDSGILEPDASEIDAVFGEMGAAAQIFAPIVVDLSERLDQAEQTSAIDRETAKARIDALDAHRIELEQARGQDQEAFQSERSALTAQARAAQEQIAAAVKAHEQVLDQKVREIFRLEEAAALLEQRCADLDASRRKIEDDRTREERRLVEELDQTQHRVKALDAHRQELETARWRDAERSGFVLDGTITAASAQLCQLKDRLESAGTSIIEAQRQLVTLSEEGRRARWQAFEQVAAPQSGPAALSRVNIVRRVLRRTSLGRAGLIALSGLWDRRSAPLFSQLRTYARGNGPSPHPLFDEAFYKLHSPDIAAQGEIGLVHYLGFGCSEGRDPHPLFDVRWYRAQAGSELEAHRMTALQHYLFRGAREGKNPHPLFDTAYYVSRAATLDIKTDNPLIHYLLGGWRSGASPHPLFDTEYYIERYPDVLRANVPPLLHYVQRGWREGRDPHPLFATSWYLSQNPDVAAAGLEPLRHYLLKGGAERRDPSPLFPSREYLDGNPDVESAGVNPLVHFLQRGAFEARLPLAGFDAVAYATGTPALAASELPPLLHAVRNDALHQVFPLRSNFEAELRDHVRALAEAARSQSPAPSLAGPPAGPARLPSAGPEPYPADRSSASGQQDGVLFTDLESNRAQAEDAYDWPAYLKLRTSLTSARRKYIEGLELPAPEMISLSGRSLEETARRLKFDRTSAPLVSIIIPAFNNARYTLECLAALRDRLGRIQAEVIVADDASTDETAGLMQLIDGLVHLRSEENRGFLRNCNGAAEKARGRIVIFLNNDVQVQPGWLEPLVEALADPGVAISAPKLLFPNGRLQEAGARLNPDGSAQLIGLFDDPGLARFNTDRDVDYASGACIAISRALFTDLGGFDDTLAPAYCEDVDLCYRARERGLRVRYVAASEVVHHLSVTSNALPGDYKLAQVRRNTQRIIGRWGKQVSEDNRVKVIANYLPQFHTIPENDRWWGAGFTEWTNVAKALPNYAGHTQPRRPGELGYYDLTNPGVLEAQTDLARRHGIDGFCVYYYWFAGRRILQRPLDMIAERHDLGFPFCICWANENWTRTWDGQDREVLLAQTYSDQDDEAVIRDMLRYIRAPHYIRVQGKPLVILYRPSLLPDAKRTADRWRAICRAQGVGEIYLAFVETFENALTYPDPASIGFDATIEFPPSGVSNPISLPGKRFNPRFEGVVSDYMTTVRRYFAEPVPGHRRFRGVMPSWDNTARRQDRSYSYHDASPGAFQAWLEWAMAVTREQNPSGERFVFVNAWNEWAEGAYLEPDKRIGRGWLEAVRNAHDAHLWPRPEDN